MEQLSYEEHVAFAAFSRNGAQISVSFFLLLLKYNSNTIKSTL